MTFIYILLLFTYSFNAHANHHDFGPLQQLILKNAILEQGSIGMHSSEGIRRMLEISRRTGIPVDLKQTLPETVYNPIALAAKTRMNPDSPSPQIMDSLLEHIQPESSDHYADHSNTPLMIALHAKNDIAARALVENGGANVNAVNSAGVTPLIIAIYTRNIPMVTYLREHGARIDRGMSSPVGIITHAAYATHLGFEDVAAILPQTSIALEEGLAPAQPRCDGAKAPGKTPSGLKATEADRTDLRRALLTKSYEKAKAAGKAPTGGSAPAKTLHESKQGSAQ